MGGGSLSSGDLLLLLACAIGLFLIPVGLPGLWIVAGAPVLHRLLVPASELSLGWIGLGLGLALLAEVAEALLGVLTARRFGATRWGMWGAFLGSIAGAIALSPLFPVVGTLVGAFAGAFAGAFLLEWKKSRTFRAGWRAGLGAFVGRVAAMAVKTGVGVAIVTLVLLQLA
ncbi:MAG: DUF456 domain-containing protein [Gemmatimonadetes bacterium]|nr:DUF456 domain-containing protein [Gemmatimonadota bacterium]